MKRNNRGREVPTIASLINVQAACEQVAEIRKEMQRLEARARDLEENLQATAKKLSPALHPETTTGRESRSFDESKGIPPLKTAPELTERVRRAMDLETKREAEIVVGVVVNALEQLLVGKLPANGFAIKLGSLGKFKVRHVGPTHRRIGFSGKVVTTNAKRKIKFVPLGMLRASEVAR